jgi:hypothetical protein
MNIIQIKLTKDYNNTDENQNKIKIVFKTLIERAIELGFWDNSIVALVITDDFSNEIETQAKKWDINVHISKEKEYTVASKILCNYNQVTPQYYIYFQFNLLLNEPSILLEIAYGQILSINANNIFPPDVLKKTPEINIKSLDDYVKYASIEWTKKEYVRVKLKYLLDNLMPTLNHNSFLIAFKRKLKKYLYEYNSDDGDNDQRISVFWYNYFESIQTLFLRIIENETSDIELQIKADDPCRELLYNVVSAIQKLTINCLNDKVFDTLQVKESIKQFSNYFEVFLENESNEGFGIHFTKNPKDYFVDEVVETEPRIVCFLDILGFSDLIKKYDEDVTSTLLQDIQESFKLATKILQEAVKQQDKDLLKHLKYYSFSDNICISLPFFETMYDFLNNFNLLCIYIRGFQLIMMTKGIFMRGGISTGSYFSDGNIIFSMGLVKAYKLECSKAIYPRVVIDEIIIERLLKNNMTELNRFGLGKVVVFDSENIAFVNHFGIMETSILQITSALESNVIDLENVDDPLLKIMSSVTDNIGNFTKILLQNLEIAEKKQLKEIKEKVIDNLLIYLENEAVVQKYLWLFEFIKWIENDGTSKLSFKYISEKINEAN